jgi:hypothetical protein
MATRAQAFYENGVLRPLEPVFPEERQCVSLILLNDAAPGENAVFESPERHKPFADITIGSDAARRALSPIPGSLDADFIAERNER